MAAGKDSPGEHSPGLFHVKGYCYHLKLPTLKSERLRLSLAIRMWVNEDYQVYVIYSMD